MGKANHQRRRRPVPKTKNQCTSLDFHGRAETFRSVAVQIQRNRKQHAEDDDKIAKWRSCQTLDPDIFFPGHCYLKDTLARDARRFRKRLPSMSRLVQRGFLYGSSNDDDEEEDDGPANSLQQQANAMLDSLPADVMARIQRDYQREGSITSRSRRSFWRRESSVWSTFSSESSHDNDDGYEDEEEQNINAGPNVRDLFDEDNPWSVRGSSNLKGFAKLMGVMNGADSDSDDDDGDLKFLFSGGIQGNPSRGSSNTSDSSDDVRRGPASTRFRKSLRSSNASFVIPTVLEGSEEDSLEGETAWRADKSSDSHTSWSVSSQQPAGENTEGQKPSSSLLPPKSAPPSVKPTLSLALALQIGRSIRKLTKNTTRGRKRSKEEEMVAESWASLVLDFDPNDTDEEDGENVGSDDEEEVEGFDTHSSNKSTDKRDFQVKWFSFRKRKGDMSDATLKTEASSVVEPRDVHAGLTA